VNLKCGKILSHETVNQDSAVCTQQDECLCRSVELQLLSSLVRLDTIKFTTVSKNSSNSNSDKSVPPGCSYINKIQTLALRDVQY
jgi:hypothetical protein